MWSYDFEILHQCGKTVKTKGQNVLGANSSVCKSYRGKNCTEGTILPLPPLPHIHTNTHTHTQTHTHILLNRVKETTVIEEFDKTKVYADEKLSDNITSRNVLILITCGKKDDSRYYLQLFSEE